MVRTPAWFSLSVVALGASGTIAALVTAFNVGGGDAGPDGRSVVRGVAVAAFVGVGLYSAWLRPRRRFGLYLVTAALLYAVASLAVSTEPLEHTVGRIAHAAFVPYLAFIFLCYPYDRPRWRRERRLAAALAVAIAALWVLAVPAVDELPPSGPLTDCGEACPDNAFQVLETSTRVSSAFAGAVGLVTATGILGVALLLVARMRSPLRLRRRFVLPVLAATAAIAANHVVFIIARQAGREDMDALVVLHAVVALSAPLLMLLGQMRGRMFASTSLTNLIARVGSEAVTPARVEALLREALGDPHLVLLLPNGGGWVDVDGRPAGSATLADEQVLTPVEREGRVVGLLIHDAALDDELDMVRSLAAMALLWLEHTGLVSDLQASRRRLVQAAQRERLRLERDLHDGAQQRLLAIQVAIDDARAREVGDAGLARDLAHAAEHAAAAAVELRELAHGIYPTVLRERGLGDALRSAAHRSPRRVGVEAPELPRCAATIEEAVYFCACEAMQNASKHAGRDSAVTVTLRREADALVFTVVDEGPGLTPAALAGMGIVSMRDRIGAVGGAFEIASGAGGGTSVRGVVPDAWRQPARGHAAERAAATPRVAEPAPADGKPADAAAATPLSARV